MCHDGRNADVGAGDVTAAVSNDRRRSAICCSVMAGGLIIANHVANESVNKRRP